MTRRRQVIGIIVIVFILYAIYTSPAKSADAVHAIWSFIVKAMTSVFAFFNHLING